MVINVVQDVKKTVMANWSLIENQPLLKENTHAFKMKKYNLKAADNTMNPRKSVFDFLLTHIL